MGGRARARRWAPRLSSPPHGPIGPAPSELEPGGSTAGTVWRHSIELVFVLGVDPGLSRCGYGVLEKRERRGVVDGGHTRQGPSSVRAVAVGVLRTDPAAPVPERLAALQDDIRALLAEYRPSVVAIERVLFQVNVRSAMSVAQASGIVMAEAQQAGCEVVEYSPNTVKQTVAGDGDADKSQMERMVQRLLGITQPLRPVDAADAVGLALCHLAHAPLAARVRAATGGAR